MDEHGRSAVERPALLAYLVFRLCARGFANDRQKSILEYKAFSAYNSRLRLVIDRYTRTRGTPESRASSLPKAQRQSAVHEATRGLWGTERRASKDPKKGQ